MAEAVSDSEDDQPASSDGYDSEEEEKKSMKKKKKTSKDEAHAQCVDILNGMDSRFERSGCVNSISALNQRK